MGGIEPNEVEPQSASERLLELSWDARERHASQRELVVEAAAAVLFTGAAAGLLAWGGLGGLRLGVAALLIAVYAVVARIEFPVGTGHVVPTQLILMPMLLMLPPAFVPVAVVLGLVSGNVIDSALGRVAPRRVLSAVPDAWHAIGPSAVLVAAGSPVIGFAQLPLLAAAFAAGCLVDLASSMVRMRLIGVLPEIRMQIPVIGLVWVVDATLAPLGFLAGITSRHHPAAILLVLPLVFLLWFLARDRHQRIDQAHRRLKLVEQERARLQSAVRRLGDAFAAKLDLNGLLEILLLGSIEALDAVAGRLELEGGASPPIRLAAGEDAGRGPLDSAAIEGGLLIAPVQVGGDDVWRLIMPMRIDASPRPLTGWLSLVRPERAFEQDEIALISELIGKAEQSGADIIGHHAIREQAMTDALTGLGNRRRLSADLDEVFGATRSASPSLLLLFDLDGFKHYNDTFGHLAGDGLLTRLGDRLQRAVAAAGRAYRLGGDEFCAYLRLDDQDPEPLINAAAAALCETGNDYSIRGSLGVVLLPHEADSADGALQLADERMYATKRSRPGGARGQAGQVLMRSMRAKQPQLGEHSANVAQLSARVARRLGVAGEALEEISAAGELHDIGKLGVPDEILNKPTGLSDHEWAVIQEHTILGEEILDGSPALRPVARLVRSSHERWDGSGYPDRLRGEDIPLGARIVSVCDAYETMTSERCYQHAIPHDAACQELRRCTGRQFDPAVVEAFLSVVEGGDELRELDPPRRAAAHVRAVLDAAPVTPQRRFQPSASIRQRHSTPLSPGASAASATSSTKR